MSDLHTSVKKLREHFGDSQQAFATRLGLSIRAIANYEKDREPTVQILVQLMKLADANGRTDLAKVFQNACSNLLGHTVPRLTAPASQSFLPGEADDVAILLTILRATSPTHKKLRSQWVSMTREIRKSFTEGTANVVALAGVQKEILRLIAAGKSDEEIVAALPAWNAAIITTFCANSRKMEGLRK